VDDRVFLFEMVGQTLPPAILSGPNNGSWSSGAPPAYTVTVSGLRRLPIEWYFNQTKRAGGSTNGFSRWRQ